MGSPVTPVPPNVVRPSNRRLTPLPLTLTRLSSSITSRIAMPHWSPAPSPVAHSPFFPSSTKALTTAISTSLSDPLILCAPLPPPSHSPVPSRPPQLPQHLMRPDLEPAISCVLSRRGKRDRTVRMPQPPSRPTNSEWSTLTIHGASTGRPGEYPHLTAKCNALW